MNKDMAYYLTRLQDPGLHYLAPLEKGERSVMDSSLNQRMGPRDCNFFLREEREAGRVWRVLVDYEGGGCITRFFMAGEERGDGRLEIYIDNESAPRIRTTLDALFGGAEWPFLKPLVLDREDSSEGRVSYVPIPFRERIVIRSDSESPNFYWQINAIRYGPQAARDVVSYTGKPDPGTARALAETCAHWRLSAPRSVPADAEAEAARDVALAPRAETVLFSDEGSGCIVRWQLHTAGLERRQLEALRVRMYWDGSGQASVDAPLLHYFCQSTKDRHFRSLLLGRSGSDWHCEFAMPYASGAVVAIVNDSGEPLTLAASVIHRSRAPHATALRFHCRTERRELLYGTLYTLLRRQGRGRLIGLAQVTEQVGPTASVANFNQEGNEYMYVDGDQDPSWIGTGTEDHFNCAYYYRRGEVAAPAHGCLDLRCTADQVLEGTEAATIAPDNRGRVAAYRFYLLDAVPYVRKLHFIQEAGCPRKGALGQVNGVERLQYAWTCYWYEEDGGDKTDEPADSHLKLDI